MLGLISHTEGHSSTHQTGTHPGSPAGGIFSQAAASHCCHKEGQTVAEWHSQGEVNPAKGVHKKHAAQLVEKERAHVAEARSQELDLM